MTIAAARMIASTLLVYPDQRFLDRREELIAITKDLEVLYREPLNSFFTRTADMSLDEIQCHYVEIFDMRRRCSLFLTSWTHGDTRNRGMALVYFKEIYKSAGILLTDEELPDHLAVVLEFAALIDPIEGDLLLGQHRAPIELLKDALHSTESFYAPVLDAVVATLPPMTPEIAERVHALAQSGPPQELVGLSGAVSIAIEPFGANRVLVADGVHR